MNAARALVAILAVAVCAWFALGIRQAHDTAQATAILSASGSLRPSQADRVQRLLDTAGTLNPDRTVELLRGDLAARAGQLGHAVQIFRRLTLQEPDNLEAWLGIAHASGGQSQLLFGALRRAAVLDPRLTIKR
jgi:Flp pilus assembly protein TadD